MPQPTPPSQAPVHKGVLFKKRLGQSRLLGLKTWKPRYVVLTSTTLSYYTFEHGKLRGQLDLTHCTEDALEILPEDANTSASSSSPIWRIALRVPSSKHQRRRRLLLAAATEWEMNEWIKKIRQTIRTLCDNRERPPRRVTRRASIAAESIPFRHSTGQIDEDMARDLAEVRREGAEEMSDDEDDSDEEQLLHELQNWPVCAKEPVPDHRKSSDALQFAQGAGQLRRRRALHHGSSRRRRMSLEGNDEDPLGLQWRDSLGDESKDEEPVDITARPRRYSTGSMMITSECDIEVAMPAVEQRASVDETTAPENLSPSCVHLGPQGSSGRSDSEFPTQTDSSSSSTSPAPSARPSLSAVTPPLFPPPGSAPAPTPITDSNDVTPQDKTWFKNLRTKWRERGRRRSMVDTSTCTIQAPTPSPANVDGALASVLTALNGPVHHVESLQDHGNGSTTAVLSSDPTANDFPYDGDARVVTQYTALWRHHASERVGTIALTATSGTETLHTVQAESDRGTESMIEDEILVTVRRRPRQTTESCWVLPSSLRVHVELDPVTVAIPTSNASKRRASLVLEQNLPTVMAAAHSTRICAA